MLAAETDHRDHAIIEQVIADLVDGPLAHLPSGNFAANAAWLTAPGSPTTCCAPPPPWPPAATAKPAAQPCAVS